jgi:SAM-dependent methyltransferase
MTSASSTFTGSIPEHYDRGLGPILFDGFAQDLAARAAARNPADVLELAAGTGIATRHIRNRLPPSARLTATDLNAPMLEIAAQKFGPADVVAFQPADAMSLPFTDGAFDLVLCQFGVMFFPDKVAAFREALRVLRPGGAYVFSVWASMPVNPYTEVVEEVAERLFPGDPPTFYRLPFGYADTALAAQHARAGGFANVKLDIVRRSQTVTDWPLFVDGVVRGNPIIVEIETRDPKGVEPFSAALIDAMRKRFGNEPGVMPLEAAVFTCTAD